MTSTPDNDKCHLQSNCGRFFNDEGIARCWCYSLEGSRKRVEDLLKEIEDLEECLDSLESSSGQLPTNNKTTTQ
jgi:hypothetical protein